MAAIKLGSLQVLKLKLAMHNPKLVKFIANYTDKYYANADDVIKVIENNNISLVDSRPAAFFVGDKKKKQALRAGRIKNSINLEQQTLVNEDGTFKSTEEIKILISQAGLQG